MQYVVKNEIEPKVSLVILLGKMEDEDYTGFYSELNHLLEKDHSLVFDCNALNEVNGPAIQAISALSSKAKGYNNVAAFFGLSNRVQQQLEEASVLSSLVVAANNFEAMKIAKNLQPQKEELRKIRFGREQNIPKSEQKKEASHTKEKDSEDPHHESPFYQHIKAQAEKAVRWEQILEEKLDTTATSLHEENPPTENVAEETPPSPTPAPEQPNTDSPLPATASKGVTQYEKEMLFSEPPQESPSTASKKKKKAVGERGVTLAEKEDLFAETPSASTPSAQHTPASNPTQTPTPQPLINPVFFTILLLIGILNIFREPIQLMLFSPEMNDAIAEHKAQKLVAPEDILPPSPEEASPALDASPSTEKTPAPAPPTINETPHASAPSESELLALVARIELPKRTDDTPPKPASTQKHAREDITPANILPPTPARKAEPQKTQETTEDIERILTVEPVEKASSGTAVNEPASVEQPSTSHEDISAPPVDTPAEIDPGLFQ